MAHLIFTLTLLTMIALAGTSQLPDDGNVETPNDLDSETPNEPVPSSENENDLNVNVRASKNCQRRCSRYSQKLDGCKENCPGFVPAREAAISTTAKFTIPAGNAGKSVCKAGAISAKPISTECVREGNKYAETLVVTTTDVNSPDIKFDYQLHRVKCNDKKTSTGRGDDVASYCTAGSTNGKGKLCLLGMEANTNECLRMDIFHCRNPATYKTEADYLNCNDILTVTPAYVIQAT